MGSVLKLSLRDDSFRPRRSLHNATEASRLLLAFSGERRRRQLRKQTLQRALNPKPFCNRLACVNPKPYTLNLKPSTPGKGVWIMPEGLALVAI